MNLILLIVFVSFPSFFSLEARSTLCLNMIVKDEEAVIERALNSVKAHIDYWVIVDTGSTDKTQAIIRNTLKDIPGELHERPWVNFNHNRTEAFTLAQTKADYLLLMDGDDWIHFQPAFQMHELTESVYEIWCEHTEFVTYLKPFLISTQLPWHYKGIIHEHPFCPTPITSAILDSARYIYTGEGTRSQDPNKYLRTARILENALQQEPTNSRYVFYLAESYRDAKKFEKALANYEKRSCMGEWEEEVFWSLFQSALIKKELNWPIAEVIHSLYRAHYFRPHRPEPIYFLAELYNEQKNYTLAHACITQFLTSQPDIKRDALFNLDWIRLYGFDLQLSISSYYLEHYQESLDFNDHLLALRILPNHVRKQVKFNRQFALKKLSQTCISS